MTQELCPRCGGPCSEDTGTFQHYCAACMSSFRTTPEGRFTAAMTMQEGKDWSDEPWIATVVPPYYPPPWIRVRNGLQLRWYRLVIWWQHAHRLGGPRRVGPLPREMLRSSFHLGEDFQGDALTSPELGYVAPQTTQRSWPQAAPPNTGFVRKAVGSSFKTALQLARAFPSGVLASRVCPYCYGTGYSSPGTRCSYCRSRVK